MEIKLVDNIPYSYQLSSDKQQYCLLSLNIPWRHAIFGCVLTDVRVVYSRFYLPLMVTFCFVIPTVVPCVFWGESLWNAYFIAAILRYCVGLNATWSVNSFAHLWGMKPYDKRINPAENISVVLSAVGEGFHNFHHTFPSDYATSEYGWHLNITTVFINCMYYLGQAYDMKKTPDRVVQMRKQRTGDGSL